ncbi:hypothetical protein E4198_07760 [Streptomyces sp. RKND-216]|uniref:hypothetical protein n=1 Tax=Streptomyces sp. RKND-216 TaxID=2562581 RepID=UPI00109E1CE8|nr:hypothetical protein [Streptomyces sp. RKND-216]THA24652.1 hypothetical protein E4198_07760 [Streptomyces sp. RKND-216]
MRLTTRLLPATALAAALTLGAAPAATAHTTPLPMSGGPTKVVHESGYGDVTARCPLGYRATGGGVAVDHKDEVATLHSRPTQDGLGWEGRALGEVEPSERNGEKQKESKERKTVKKAEKKQDELDRPDEKLHGLPLTVYAVCSL